MRNVNSELEWNGKEVIQDFDKMMYKSLYESGAIVEAQAIDTVAVDTGHLKQSITKQVRANSVDIGTNVEYASHVEFGTRKQTAQPFLLPALLDNINKIFTVFKKNGINLKWIN